MAYDILHQTTDAELLARATIWAGANPRARDQIFKITNGDQFRWAQLWPQFAEHFGMDYAAPQQMSLSDAMPTRGDVWTSLVRKYDLVDTPFDQLVAWPVGDFLFHHEADNITSTIKARQAGFANALDTPSRLLDLFDELIAMKVLPPTLSAAEH